MCGRYSFYLNPAELKSRLGLDNLLNIPPRYNCAPIQSLPIVVKNRLGNARWGFQAPWADADDMGMAAKMINARSETVYEKPAYKDAWAVARRCIVPANGFYEWQKSESGEKQPFYIQHAERDMLYFAGLWAKKDGQVSYTILTKAADENLSHLHHRSPVMIEEQAVSEWFAADAERARDMMLASSTDVLKFHPVAKDVGKVANDHEALMDVCEIIDTPKAEAQGQLL